MSLLDICLALAGMPEAERADLEAKIPALGRIATLMKSVEPDLTAAKPHFDALVPIFNKVVPVFQQAWPDIVAVAPTADEFIAFVQSKV
jgi:hypothetical protein